MPFLLASHSQSLLSNFYKVFSGYIISHWSFWYPESYSACYRSLQMKAQPVSKAMQVLPVQIRECGPKRGNILGDFNVCVTISEVDVSMGIW